MSLVPRPKANPRMGPITGEISMAPIITGIELTFKPTEAIIMAHARMKTFGPLKAILLRIILLAP